MTLLIATVFAQGNTRFSKIYFERDIQPIFAERCFSCHGQATHIKDFRLDMKTSALRTNPGGATPIVPYRAKDSLLFHLVEGKSGKRMPPQGAPLTAKQISTLRRWIDTGANWPESAASLAKSHWAYRPIKQPAIPKVSAWTDTNNLKSTIINPIDSFINLNLMSHGVLPSPRADKVTLLRRLHSDLTGLPPTADETREFLQDVRPDAYERLVDRLLASPHFGERWGRKWLDLARYADSDGYEKDNVRPHAWRYRNWVIDAINADMPFDQFTTEQLAGDLLPNATLDQKIATGFHRNTLTNTEGGVDQEEFRCKATVDRVSTTATVWLGLTLQCAECHDHKFDPFSQREFYQLYAFFNSENEVNIPAPLASEQAAYDAGMKQYRERLDAAKRVHEAALVDLRSTKLPQRIAAWEKDARLGAVRWQPMLLKDSSTKNGATIKTYDGGIFQASGKNPDTETYTLIADLLSGSRVSAIRLEALSDRALPSSGPGRTPHGNFVLTEVELVRRSPGKPDVSVKLSSGSATFTQNEFDPKGVFDGNPRTGWAIAPQMSRSHTAVFNLAEPFAPEPGEKLVITLRQDYGGIHTLGKGRLSFTWAKDAVASTIPDSLVNALMLASEKRTPEQQAAVEKYYLALDPDAQALDKKLKEVESTAPKQPSTMAQTLVEAAQPRKTFIHLRGDFQSHGDEVKSGMPQTLHELHITGSAQPNRLDLAKWLVDPANPLTPRVAVNRVWQNLFGRGLVGTPDDFGVRGERPSHPELLDWLAATFIAKNDTASSKSYFNCGWSVKRLIKLIVTSETYKQSSAARPELASVDANNQWLARQNRFRVEAELIRDAALAASGLLDKRIGGPSVRPPLPPGIAELGYAGSVRWENSKGADKYRRGLYIFFQRTVPYPMLNTFDAPDGVVCAARRERSNTPLQALTTLNDPVFVECAQALGKRVLAEAPKETIGRIEYLWQTCFNRKPTKSEAAAMLKTYDRMRVLAAKSSDATMLSGGVKKDQDLIEAATWTAMARIVLNTDEFFVRE
jgi:hypothetical protein